MTKCIVFTRSDGTTAITYPLGPRLQIPINGGFREEGEDEWIERLAAQDVPVLLQDGTELDKRTADAQGLTYTQLPYSIILKVNVPSNREYRNAWEVSGGLLRHNMVKCRSLHRERIRVMRRGVLQNLDALWMRATALGQTAIAAAVEAKRQAWRDAPADPRIDAAADVDALKAIPLPEA